MESIGAVYDDAVFPKIYAIFLVGLVLVDAA
jgi:hypothetical protein